MEYLNDSCKEQMIPAEQLIFEIKKGLLNWYDFKPDSRILFIQKQDYMGDRNWKEEWLYSCIRQINSVSAEKASVAQTSIGEWVEEHIHRFDYIISIQELERQGNPEKILKIWKSLLKPDGILLLGMNNRFGLKYFCGDRDPYTERNFDGIEGYRRAYAKKEDEFTGRCYSREEMREMLSEAGWESMQFFSVLSDLDNPRLIYGEDSLPNEDLSNRLFPTYHYPKSVFLEEESLYDGLIKNGMFHQMANAYLVECSLNGELCDISHVTSSMERGRNNALLTIIRRSGIVEKRAAYEEGRERLHKLLEHGQELAERGIPVIDAKIEKDLHGEDIYVMPYIKEESGQLYLKRLLHTDREQFFKEMDHFRDLILQSSEIVKPDRGDGEGAILKKGYLDMVPLNSFHVDGTFLFYDQEFCEENYPANEMIWRMIATFYAGDIEVGKLLPVNQLLERYGLMEKLETWQKMEWDFLAELRKEKELRPYHEKCRRDSGIVNANRQRMNFSADEYQKLFVDIFHNADTRKLILFGSGNFTKRFLGMYRQDYPVYAVVDNNQEKWGQEIEGIPIQPPDIIKQMQSGEYKVLICIKNYLSVLKQLDEMGVREYSIYDSGKDYPRKRRPVVSDTLAGSMKDSGANSLASNGADGGTGGPGFRKRFHTGYIAGVFDLFHVGHLNMFKRAKEQCDYLIVGVVTDEGVRKYKKTEPFIPFEERIELVRACRYVDEVVDIPVNYGGTRDAYKLLHFDCQFSGSDYADNPDWLMEKEFLEKNGAEMVFFPYTESTSSSQIKQLIEERIL